MISWEVLFPAGVAVYRGQIGQASSPRRTEGSGRPSARSPVQLYMKKYEPKSRGLFNSEVKRTQRNHPTKGIKAKVLCQRLIAQLC